MTEKAPRPAADQQQPNTPAQEQARPDDTAESRPAGNVKDQPAPKTARKDELARAVDPRIGSGT